MDSITPRFLLFDYTDDLEFVYDELRLHYDPQAYVDCSRGQRVAEFEKFFSRVMMYVKNFWTEKAISDL